jgi:GrpB-like predicted nucleotidyltransferase (UPF0157 family)
MQKRIVLVPYDPQWPAEFRRIALPLRETLGELALRIDHIGSTAVPGLAAKDVIDIQITVKALDVETLVPLFTGPGYRYWEDITGDHLPPGRNDAPEEWCKLFFSAPQGRRRTNIHVRLEGRANQRYALLFRDYLRADARVTGAYQQIKEALARLLPEDFEAYYDVKDPACDIILAAAELWSELTGYAPGAPDL